MKIDNKGIELCGEYRKYRKCTNKELLEHQKAIEEEQEKYQPIIDESEEIRTNGELVDTQIKSIKDYCEAIKNKSDPSDDELDRVAEYSLKLIELVEEKTNLINQSKKLDKKHRKDIRNVEKYIVEKYGELAELQVEISKEEYIEKSDNVDAEIVKLLASIKKMFLLGSSNKDVEKFIKMNVNHEVKQLFRNDRN